MVKLNDIKYKLGRGLTLIGLAALPFAACKKDEDVKPSTPAQQTKKHNVELMYSNGSYDNIALDTIYKYNSDPNVDSIFMIPVPVNTFSTLTAEQLRKRVNRLRECHNVNPNKVFGKGELKLWNQSTLHNPEIYYFFADTLRYNVTFYSTMSKSR